jgi:hypothetical protein
MSEKTAEEKLQELRDENINLKFKGVIAQINANQETMDLSIEGLEKRLSEKLDTIHYEVKRTNGRVTKLEADYTLLDASYHRLEEKHVICPINNVQKEIDDLKKSTEIITFFTNKPKVFKLFIWLIILAASGYYGINIIELVKNVLN